MGKYIVHSRLRNIGAQVQTQTGQHQFIIDEPIVGNGTDAGPNPVQYLLAAVGGCLVITANDIARKDTSLEIKKFEVKTSGETRLYQDKSSDISKIKIQIHTETNLDNQHQKYFIHQVLKECTIHKTLSGAIPIETIID